MSNVRPHMRTVGYLVAFGGVALTLFLLSGLGGVLSCGTFGLTCLGYAVLAALASQAVAAGLLFGGASSSAPRSVGRYLTIFFAVVCSLVVLAILVVFSMVATR